MHLMPGDLVRHRRWVPEQVGTVRGISDAGHVYVRWHGNTSLPVETIAADLERLTTAERDDPHYADIPST